MSRFIPTAICAVLCILCFALAFDSGRKFSQPPDASFAGPGTFSFSAAETAEYTLWHVYTGAVEGEFSVHEADLPTGTKIRVTHAGGLIPAVADMTTTTSSANGQRKSVLHFVAPTAGEYQIEVSGFTDKREFQITHGPILMPLVFTILWIGGATLLAVLAVVLGILAALRVFPKGPSQGRAEEAGPPLLRA